MLAERVMWLYLPSANLDSNYNNGFDHSDKVPSIGYI